MQMKSDCLFGPVMRVLKSAHHWTTGKNESGKLISWIFLRKDEHKFLREDCGNVKADVSRVF